MGIKETLLKESKTLNQPIELTAMFESVELSEDVKEKFSTVFESAVKKRAIDLAESHINEIVENAETYLAEQKQEVLKEVSGSVNEYLSYTTENWLQENKLAVETGLKSQMFDSLLGEMKNMFIEHNITIPEESVNVVEELEGELAESSVELDKLIKANAELNEKLSNLSRDRIVEKATVGLTASQKERVNELAENLSLDEKFESKLSHIVDMVSEKENDDDEDETDKKDKKDDKKLDEKGKKPMKDSDEGLNYKSGDDDDDKKKDKELSEEDKMRKQYAQQASRIAV